MTAVITSESDTPGTDSANSPHYDPRLTNEDLAPTEEKTWGIYNFIAFWMTDVHSVGGYTTAGSLFALGLAGWQVFVALIVAVLISYGLSLLVAEPSQRTGVPFPVTCRLAFGVLGANIPALIRGIIAVAWYGMQTYLASHALTLVLIKFFPALIPYATATEYGFVGLSALGWATFMFVWTLQAVIFWQGMDMIRKFVDWSGPAVYVVMCSLCGWLIYEAGWDAIHFNLGSTNIHLGFWASLLTMIGAVGLVVSFFGGPVLNFGDFARYGKSLSVIRTSGIFGLPVNFVFFSLLVVVTASLTAPVFGTMIIDPNEVVVRIPSSVAMAIGVLTILIATMGINIVANFVSPAFDFSNLNPQRISWLGGGMIAAVISIFIAPWKLIANPEAIHYTLETIGAFIGALYGVIVVDYFLVRRKKIIVPDLFTMSSSGKYWYTRGFNLKAIAAAILGGGVAVTCILLGGKDSHLVLHTIAQCSWFAGAVVSGLVYAVIMRDTTPITPPSSPHLENTVT